MEEQTLKFFDFVLAGIVPPLLNWDVAFDGEQPLGITTRRRLTSDLQPVLTFLTTLAQQQTGQPGTIPNNADFTQILVDAINDNMTLYISYLLAASTPESQVYFSTVTQVVAKAGQQPPSKKSSKKGPKSKKKGSKKSSKKVSKKSSKKMNKISSKKKGSTKSKSKKSQRMMMMKKSSSSKRKMPKRSRIGATGQ